MSEILLKEYRGELCENVRRGAVAVVDDNKRVVASIGDIGRTCYYRSSSKPFQAIPSLVRGLPQSFGFAPDEISILNASHQGAKHHIETLKSLFAKAGLKEEDLIMKPAYSMNRVQNPDGPTKFQHNCAGKHANLMLLQRELTGKVDNYWKLESPAQQEVLKSMSYFTDVPMDKIITGVDGCGVPVFAVPLTDMAWSYTKLACPDLIKDEAIRKAVEFDLENIHKAPEKVSDFNQISCILTSDPNVFAKEGVGGVYCISLAKERLGIAMKIDDGPLLGQIQLVIINVLEQIGYRQDIIDKIKAITPVEFRNDNDFVIGKFVSDFKMNIVR